MHEGREKRWLVKRVLTEGDLPVVLTTLAEVDQWLHAPMERR